MQASIERGWRDKPPDVDTAVRRTEACDPAPSLFQPERGPREIVVNDGVGVLQIQPFAYQVCSDERGNDLGCRWLRRAPGIWCEHPEHGFESERAGSNPPALTRHDRHTLPGKLTG